MSTAGDPVAGDLVPLADRSGFLRLLRLGYAGVVLAAAHTLALGDRYALVRLTAGYLLVAASGALANVTAVRHARAVFGGLLLVDGAYLVAATTLGGGTTSPLRYLVLVHLIAACLLASYRTGVKLALWDSLLLLVAVQAGRTGLLRAEPDGEAALSRLVVFAAVVWVVTLATATFSAVNERELRRRRVDLEALAAFATELERADDPRAVAEVVVRHVRSAFGGPRCAILLGDGDRHLVVAGAGASVDRRSVDSALVRDAVDERRTDLVAARRARTDAGLLSILADPGNLVVVPVSAEGRSIGALVVEHGRGGRIERRVVEMLERFAAHAGQALRVAQLVEELRQRAATDGLTGIANRATFEHTLSREVSRARRTGEPLSLVLFDLDHFKDLNDTHGHQAGDDVLRTFASVLAGSCRDFDTAARFGGEEFALVLPRCASGEAVAIADRVRAALREAETPVPVTTSAGVATWPENAAFPEGMVAAADGALYESKGSGRDRVTASSERHLEPVSVEPPRRASATR